MNIDEKLQALKVQRENLAVAKDLMSKALSDFKTSDDVYSFQSEVAAKAQERIETLESEIKSEAVDWYKQTGSKKPHDKVEVKIFKTFSIIDPKKVFEWAWTHLPDAFKLDEKKIEKYALEFGDVDGTQKGEEPRAQIASKL